MTMNLRRSLMGPYQRGVPSQYVVHYHPWPTRFHGPLYQRPVFRFPWQSSPQNVFKPGDFYPGELTEAQMVSGLGTPEEVAEEGRYMAGQEAILYDVGRGVFKPGGYGGGIFDGNLSGITAVSGIRPRAGYLSMLPVGQIQTTDWKRYAAFAAGAALVLGAVGGADYLARRKKGA